MLAGGGSGMDAKLLALRMRLNAGRKDNYGEVVNEHRRLHASDRDLDAKERRAIFGSIPGVTSKPKSLAPTAAAGKRKRYNEDGTEVADDALPAYMHESAADAEAGVAAGAERAARKAGSYGWNAFNDDAQVRAYERRLRDLPTADASGAASSTAVVAAAGGAGADAVAPLSYGGTGAVDPVRTEALDSVWGCLAPPHIPPPHSNSFGRLQGGVERMVAELKKRDEGRRKWHRRRAVGEDSGGPHISESNRRFNDRLDRHMGKYTVDIKQALERGSAL